MQPKFWSRFATFLIWLLAGASLVYWALKFVPGSQLPATAQVASNAHAALTAHPQSLALGLGGALQPAAASAAAEPTPPAIQAARFVLKGVVLRDSGNSKNSLALIAVDGKPPRPYRVGSTLTEGVILHSVAAGRALLSASIDAEPSVTLELPRLTSALAGTAVAVRPNLPPTAGAATPVAQVAHPAAMPAADSDPRAARLAASRMREVQKKEQEEARTASEP